MMSVVGGLVGSAGRRGVVPRAGVDQVFPVPTGDDGAWVAQARRIPCFACEAVFRIEPDVGIGPRSGGSGSGWDAANVRLPPVDLPRRFADRATTAELIDREDNLVAHYRRIIAIVERDGRTGAPEPFPYFRIQPAVVADGALLFDFPWTDDLHETRTVLEALVGAADGPPRLVHSDQDQGWGLLVVATDAATCLMEWDAEGPPPAEGGFAFDRAALARQATAVLERLEIIHARLVDAIGRDCWTPAGGNGKEAGR